MTELTSGNLIVSCEREDLLTALQAADAVVPSNSTKPILTNLMIDVQNDAMEIIATDLQVGLRAVMRRLEVTSPGQVVVPARQLVGILKESRSPLVKLELRFNEGGGQLAIELADGRYTVPAVVNEVFPAVSVFPSDGIRLVIPGDRLETMIRKTAFAVDRDRTSAVLSGVNLVVRDGELILAATDGKVLCEAVSQDPSFDQDVNVIIPAATVNHLNRILSSASPEQVEIALAGKLIFVRVVVGSGQVGGAGNIQIELTSRLVDGSYPSYRNALPRNSEGRVTYQTSELASAVRRTALMTSQASRGIVVELASDQAVLSNLNATSGSARIPVRCAYDGMEQRLGINAGYLTDILRVFSHDEISMELNGLGKGIIIREDGHTYLIMPISLPS